MGVCECHTLFDECIEVRCGKTGSVRVQGIDVAVTHIVHHENQNVGRLGFLSQSDGFHQPGQFEGQQAQQGKDD